MYLNKKDSSNFLFLVPWYGVANKPCHWPTHSVTSWEFRVQRLGGSVDLVANSSFEESPFCFLNYFSAFSRFQRYAFFDHSMWAWGPGSGVTVIACWEVAATTSTTSNVHASAELSLISYNLYLQNAWSFKRNRIQCLIVLEHQCVFGISCWNRRQEMMKQQNKKDSNMCSTYYLWPKSRTLHI